MWRAPLFNLHATGGLTTEKIACVATSCVQNLHALAAITLESPQYFAMTLGFQCLNLKNEDLSKKSKIVRGNRAYRGLSNSTKHRFLQSGERVPLKLNGHFYLLRGVTPNQITQQNSLQRAGAP